MSDTDPFEDEEARGEGPGEDEDLPEAVAPAPFVRDRVVSGERYKDLVLMKGNGTAYRMDHAAKARACAAYAETGHLYMAALRAGCSTETLRQHRRIDEVFEEAMEEARLEFCARLEAEAMRRAFKGTLEPIIGRVDKDKDGVITYVRRYSDRLTELLLKRHMPNEYVERMQVEQQVSGGVLVVGVPLTAEQWVERATRPREQPTLPILEQLRHELEQK